MKPLAGLLFIIGLVVVMIGMVSGEPLEEFGGLVIILISCIGLIPRR